MTLWAGLAAVTLACGRAESEGAPGGGGGGAAGAIPPSPVEVVVASTDTVVDAILATGQIEAFQSIDLRPDVDGRIREILVDEGSVVDSGAPLFRIDDAELRVQVAQAEANRDLAAADLQRARELKRTDGISQADLDRAEASARTTRAQYDLLKLRLDRTVVRAPFPGVAGQRFVSLGDYVTNSTRMISLQTVNPQRAVFDVPERFAEDLRAGQLVTFRIAALPGRTFTGRVDFVDPVVQSATRAITVKATVPNPGRRLQAGMFLELRLATETRPHAVVIPEEAVVPQAQGVFVWVVQDGKAQRRTVELGVRSPGFVEVRSGVQAGEQVVVGGQDRLVPEAPVAPTVVERKPVRQAPEGSPSTS